MRSTKNMLGVVVSCGLVVTACADDVDREVTGDSSFEAESSTGAEESLWQLGALEVVDQGAVMHGVNGISFGPNGEKLYATTVAGAEAVVLDPDTGVIEQRFSADHNVAGPDDVAFGPDGRMYLTNFLAGTVTRIDPDGSSSVIADLGPGVNPVTVSDEGRLFVGKCFLGDGLWELDPEGHEPPRVLVESFGGGCGLNGFDMGPDGRLWGPRFVVPELVAIDIDSGDLQKISGDFIAPNGVKFHAGQMSVLDTGAGTVVEYNWEKLAAGEHDAGVVRARGLTGFDSHAFDRSGRLFASDPSEGQIYEIVDVEQHRPVFADQGLTLPGGVAVYQAADGLPTVAVADWDVLRRYDARDGRELEPQRSIIGLPGLSAAASVAATWPCTSLDQPHCWPVVEGPVPAGQLLVASSFMMNSVKVWDPEQARVLAQYEVQVPTDALAYAGGIAVSELATGSVRWLGADGSSRQLATGLTVPAGLAVGDDGALYVADMAMGTVLRVAEGGQPLATPAAVAGGLAGPEGLAFAPDGRLLVVEAMAARLSAIGLLDGSLEVLAQDLAVGRTAPQGLPPTGVFNGVSVAPDGSVWLTGDVKNLLYRLPAY